MSIRNIESVLTLSSYSFLSALNLVLMTALIILYNMYVSKITIEWIRVGNENACGTLMSSLFYMNSCFINGLSKHFDYLEIFGFERFQTLLKKQQQFVYNMTNLAIVSSSLFLMIKL